MRCRLWKEGAAFALFTAFSLLFLLPRIGPLPSLIGPEPDLLVDLPAKSSELGAGGL